MTAWLRKLKNTIAGRHLENIDPQADTFKRFSDRSRMVMALANRAAQRLNHEQINAGHILLGLVEEGGGVGANALKLLNVDLSALRAELEKALAPGPATVREGKLPQTADAKEVVIGALAESRKLSDPHIGTEHMLLAILHNPGSVGGRVLSRLGVELETARAVVRTMVGRQH